MTLDTALQALAVIIPVAALATVVTEIVTRDPRILWEIVTDVRAMARPDRHGPANSNRPGRSTDRRAA
ncbi:hypothetical protein [Azospirillum halopraeferens]|uniref:hypothetical protein n=1 Tax=Azospirillum halopraeferens TaxID=34010 RepID=UPI0003FC61F3|nr:hypothetical protein [Azospirillum halopraeferens]